MRVVDFLEDYALAYSAGDMDDLVSFYDLPVSFVRPEGSVLFTSSEALLGELEASRNVYVAAGMARARGSSVEEVGFDEGMGILNVRWEMYRRPGTLLTTISTTYVLRQRDGLIRIGGVIAHNDTDRRRMLTGNIPAAPRRAKRAGRPALPEARRNPRPPEEDRRRGAS